LKAINFLYELYFSQLSEFIIFWRPDSFASDHLPLMNCLAAVGARHYFGVQIRLKKAINFRYKLYISQLSGLIVFGVRILLQVITFF